MKHNEMIREEQRKLDELIRDMDHTLLELDNKLTESSLAARKAREQSLPDTYGALVDAEHDKRVTRDQIKNLRRGRDELYDTRLILDFHDSKENGTEELKVGLHSYVKYDRVFIVSWVREMVRPFILNDTVTESDCYVIDKHGDKMLTHYTLRLKRNVDMFFDRIKDVTHLYPLTEEEAEQIIADEFLKELLSRRSEQEFRNIVFSIQKQQGEIIQTPFRQNMIVQGCAGSGKSMIMLHRLPILLYDNPKTLKRSDMFIITPSIAYIQMVDNMCRELEISDLEMGTLDEYYEYLIERYNYSAEEIGKVIPGYKLYGAHVEDIYSDKFNKWVSAKIESLIRKGLEGENSISEFVDNSEEIKGYPQQKIRILIGKLQSMIDDNNRQLRQFHKLLNECLSDMADICRALSARKTAIIRKCQRMIDQANRDGETAAKRIRRMDPVADEEKVKKQTDIINKARQSIEKYRSFMATAEDNDEYFLKLRAISTEAEKVSALFQVVTVTWEEVDIQDLYFAINQRAYLAYGYNKLKEEISIVGDQYADYIDPFDSLFAKYEHAFLDLSVNVINYLTYNTLESIIKARDYYTSLEKNMVSHVYKSALKSLKITPDKNGKLNVPADAYYIYLRTIFAFQGPPAAPGERLITIDEAQNISPQELQLIKGINGNNLILNLFGDVRQHVERNKGIDSWDELKHIAKFSVKTMRENYRNARQITEYCNNRFRMNMEAINLDGSGTHEISTYEMFLDRFLKALKRPQKPGLNCIIVKNRFEADTILKLASSSENKIHNMTAGDGEIHRNKWNLMTVDQAKGLEFETVFAVSGRMSENEKYIAYTRALDELYVYEDELTNLVVESEQNIKSNKKNAELVPERKKRKKTSASSATGSSTEHSEVVKFFQNSGLKVIDDRMKSGYLWVIGERPEIEPYVNQASEQFNITGAYGNGKSSGFRNGWYTKTKR